MSALMKTFTMRGRCLVGGGWGVYPLMNKPLYTGEYSDDRWHKLFYIGSPFLTALIGLFLILIGLFQ